MVNCLNNISKDGEFKSYMKKMENNKITLYISNCQIFEVKLTLFHGICQFLVKDNDTCLFHIELPLNFQWFEVGRMKKIYNLIILIMFPNQN